MKEYYQFNPALYDFVSTGIDGDIDFYAEEAMKAGSPVLELGCGTGRILIPIAQEGIEITGLDQSPDMLSRAKEKTAKLDDETRNRIELVQGDMRSFSFKKKFNLIIIPYRAFLHLLTSEDQMMALTCIRNHLKDDGKLILNFFDPNLEMIAAHSGYLGAACKKMQECIHPDNGNRIIVWDNLKYHPASQLIDINFIFEELDKTGRVISKHYIFMNMRYIFRYEMQHLLELCGFKIEALYGDCRRGDFRYAGEQVWVVRKGS